MLREVLHPLRDARYGTRSIPRQVVDAADHGRLMATGAGKVHGPAGRYGSCLKYPSRRTLLWLVANCRVGPSTREFVFVLCKAGGAKEFLWPANVLWASGETRAPQ